MSYRTFKRLLGETSLERKCRFLFGGGLLILITLSFGLYGSLTSGVVDEQNRVFGRLLVSPILIKRHWEWSEKQVDGVDDQGFSRYIEVISKEAQPKDLADYRWDLLIPGSTIPKQTITTQEDFDALLELKREKTKEVTFIKKTDDGKHEFQFYSAILAESSCVACHAKVLGQDVEEGALMGMAKVTIPMTSTERAQAFNNAMLLTTAIITTFLAMVATFTIARYVIVKPVLHLKEVSDAISRGNLDRRADIRTGDEFEELSQAYNRMLRHLVAVQEELRQVNTALDSKVDELAQANMQLFELNNIKNEFMATMTHELRTPLNSILGFSDVLAGADNLNEKQQRYVRNIQTSGKDLLTLVNDILDLAKIEAGKMDLHLVEFSIGDLVERLSGMMKPLAERRNIELTCEVDPRMPLLSQDSGKIQQILYNLLSNAVKFTPEGGRVQLNANWVDEKSFELIVEDTGVGIPLEEQEMIFEKFRQGKTAPGGEQTLLTREYAGTGLGLSIVRELSKLLGGNVTLTSELGKGSRFTVRLPQSLHEQPRPLAEVLARPLLTNPVRDSEIPRPNTRAS
ncbi:MAG: HAMP domain-containing protein [Planctomycetes bacterium]|nr:HAMP domain-containing protein [Planctomycetota bacterium]